MNNIDISSVMIYGTSGCHLCELATALFDDEQVQSLLKQRQLQLIECDISSDSSLVERYGVRIPVVLKGGASGDLGWPFDAEQLFNYLAQ